MDRLLKPSCFELELNSPNSEKVYKHWKITFQHYLNTILPISESSAEQDTNNQTKLYDLINSISANVFDLISDAT